MMDELQLRLFHAAMRYSEDVVFICDTEGTLCYVNEVCARDHRLPADKVVGQGLKDLFPEETWIRQKKTIDQVLKSGKEVVVEREIVLYDTPRWYRSVYFPLGEYNGRTMVGSIAKNTTTVHKQQLTEFKHPKPKLQLITALPDLVFLVNRNGVFVDFHAPAEMSLLIDRDAIIGSSIENLPMPESQIGLVRITLEKTFQTGELQQFEYELEAPDGLRYYEARMKLLDTDRLLLIVRNITTSKKAQQALRASEELNRGIVENAPVGILIFNEEGVASYANPTFSELMGVPDNATPTLLGQHYRDIECFAYSGLSAIIDHLFDGEIIRNRELDHVSDYGAHRNLEIHGSPLKQADDTISGVVVLMLDKTDLRNLEQQFHQAQKMEAIGRLAGGVAHDFNNLLTAILGHSDLALWTLAPEHRAIPELLEVQSVVNRASMLTQQLLAFGRRQVMQPEVLDLNQALKSMDQIFLRTVGEDIKIRKQLAKDLGNVLADRNQIGQVLLNLVINARDAMEQGGVITFETSNVFISEEAAQAPSPLKAGQYIHLSVSDTGIGIPEEIWPHIFEPFFTTKEAGKGTGLGLSTVHGIIKSLGGDIQFESEVGKGTTFHLYLKQTDSPVHKVAETLSDTSRATGSENILVVEDDESVLASTTRYLHRCGYTILKAQTAEGALDLANNPDNRIDLLLTDVVLPTMKGPELAELIQKQRPGIKILFVSGYSKNMINHHSLQQPGIAFLPKPYKFQLLAQKIRMLLDVRAEGAMGASDVGV